MSGQEKQALALVVSANWGFHVFDANKLLFSIGRHERQADEFGKESSEMGIISLGEPSNLDFREIAAEHATQVGVNEAAAKWEEVVEGFADPGNVSMPWLGAGNRRSAISGMGEGNFEGSNSVAVKDGLRFGIWLDARCSIGITADAEVGGADLAQSCFAREEFAASFFGGKASGEAGGATGSVPGVGQFSLGEQVFEAGGGPIGEQPFKAADRHGIEAATSRVRTACVH
jgi:hypothetical protein